jgi:hypothetical protein
VPAGAGRVVVSARPPGARRGHRLSRSPQGGAACGLSASATLCSAAIRPARQHAAGPPATASRCWPSAAPARGRPGGLAPTAASRHWRSSVHVKNSYTAFKGHRVITQINSAHKDDALDGCGTAIPAPGAGHRPLVTTSGGYSDLRPEQGTRFPGSSFLPAAAAGGDALSRPRERPVLKEMA